MLLQSLTEATLDFGTAVTSIVFKVSFCSSIEKKHYQNNGKQKRGNKKITTPNKSIHSYKVAETWYPLCKQSAKRKRSISTPTNMIIRTVFCLPLLFVIRFKWALKQSPHLLLSSKSNPQCIFSQEIELRLHQCQLPTRVRLIIATGNDISIQIKVFLSTIFHAFYFKCTINDFV